MGVGRQPWAQGAAALVIGCVVLNQLVGPTLCRFGIRSAGEAMADKEDIEFDPGVDRDLQDEQVVTPRQRAGRRVTFSTELARRRSDSGRMAALKATRPRTASALTTMGEAEDLVSETTRKRRAVSMVYPDLERELQVN